MIVSNDKFSLINDYVVIQVRMYSVSYAIKGLVVGEITDTCSFYGEDVVYPLRLKLKKPMIVVDVGSESRRVLNYRDIEERISRNAPRKDSSLTSIVSWVDNSVYVNTMPRPHYNLATINGKSITRLFGNNPKTWPNPVFSMIFDVPVVNTQNSKEDVINSRYMDSRIGVVVKDKEELLYYIVGDYL